MITGNMDYMPDLQEEHIVQPEVPAAAEAGTRQQAKPPPAATVAVLL